MKVIARLRVLLGSVAAVTLLALMLIMLVDVIGRKLFSQPVIGSVELSELLLLITVYLAIPLVSENQEHVHLDFAENFFHARVQKIQLRIGETVCGLLTLGGAYLILLKALRSAEDGETTTLLQIPMYPFFYAVAFLLLITALVHLYFAIVGASTQDEAQVLEI